MPTVRRTSGVVLVCAAPCSTVRNTRISPPLQLICFLLGICHPPPAPPVSLFLVTPCFSTEQFDTMGGEAVTISSLALTAIALHSRRHRTTQVHGVLTGSTKDSTVEVKDALPVCHESPTKPLVESALALSMSAIPEGSEVVGWYTVPEMLQGTDPGPAALRIAASLESSTEKPILVVVSKMRLEKLTNAGESDEGGLVAFGKDFGQQWKEKIPATTSSTETARKAVQALADTDTFCDLVDHWHSPLTTEWPKTAALEAQLKTWL